jgi:hypothetical protein
MWISIMKQSLKTGRDAARRRFWLAVAGFVTALALLPFSYKVERRLETAAHIKGGESESVDLELAQRSQSPYAQRLVLVISGIPNPDSFASLCPLFTRFQAAKGQGWGAKTVLCSLVAPISRSSGIYCASNDASWAFRVRLTGSEVQFPEVRPNRRRLRRFHRPQQSHWR